MSANAQKTAEQLHADRVRYAERLVIDMERDKDNLREQVRKLSLRVAQHEVAEPKGAE